MSKICIILALILLLKLKNRNDTREVVWVLIQLADIFKFCSFSLILVSTDKIYQHSRRRLAKFPNTWKSVKMIPAHAVFQLPSRCLI